MSLPLVASKHPLCDGCSYEYVGGKFIPPDESSPKKKVMLWGEAGGADEAREERGFVGPAGRLLRKTVSKLGLSVWSPDPRDDHILCSNVVLCRPPGNVFPGAGVARECLRRHEHDQEEGLPWVALGGNAVEALTGFALPPLETRGSFLPVLGRDKWVVSSIHPAFALHGGGDKKSMSEVIPLIRLDVRRAMTCSAPKVPTWNVPTAHEVQQLIKRSGSKFVSIDIEGRDGVPNIVGFCWESGHTAVLDWGPETKALVTWIIMAGLVPIFHNAAYDVPELQAAGVEPPKVWIDTINLAALCDPGLKKRLGVQVLTWVPGTTAWKKLIDHQRGPSYDGGVVGEYRRLWTEILRRLGRPAPYDGDGWYRFYNALDTAWAFDLAFSQRELLEAQGRMGYYRDIMQPLQRPLLSMGQRGLPVDPKRIEFHSRGCQRLVRMANRILKEAAAPMIQERLNTLRGEWEALDRAREEWKGRGGKGAYPGGKAIAKARGKVKRAEDDLEEGFNFDSTPQRKALLYDWYGLPPVSKQSKDKDGKKKRAITTDDDACESLILRLTKVDLEGDVAKSAIKPTRGTRDEVVRVLRALIAGKKWRTWDSNFLQGKLIEGAPGKRPRLPTQYHQHRSDTGRLASGTDDSDEEKKKKVQQLQNVPEKLRDIVVPDPGMTLIGLDYSGIEWAIAMWDCMNIPASIYQARGIPTGFHEALLERQQKGEFDPHRYLGSFAFDKPEEEVTRDERKMCKPYTHGRTFKGGASTLARGAGHTDAVGEFVCNAHEKAFVLRFWQTFIENQVKRQGYVETAARWRRYFWDQDPKPTEVLATRIQGSAADLMKWVLVQIFEKVEREKPEWEILTTTHDSMLSQVPTPQAVAACGWFKAQMEQAVPFLGGRGWRVDAKIGMSWRAV